MYYINENDQGEYFYLFKNSEEKTKQYQKTFINGEIYMFEGKNKYVKAIKVKFYDGVFFELTRKIVYTVEEMNRILKNQKRKKCFY